MPSSPEVPSVTGSGSVRPETVGVTTQLPGSVTEPAGTQPEAGSAPAIPGTMAMEATARLAPTINRLAHMMVALLPVEAPPLRSPKTRVSDPSVDPRPVDP